MVSLALPAPVIDPMNALRLPAGNRNPSGYANVYAHGRGWVARVKVSGRILNLSAPDGSFRQPTPRDAAKLVAAWYEERYGPDWHLRFRRDRYRLGIDRRRARPWAIRRARGGWVVSVWEWGREVELGDHLHATNPAADSPRRRPWVYTSRDAAVAVLAAWRRWGLVARWGDRARWAMGL